MDFIPLRRQFQSIQTEIMQQISEVIESGTFILGPKVLELEQAVAARTECTEAVSVANGTDALVLTLDALGIGPGDEVITTPFTFFATAEAISRVGARPVFADIDPLTCNLDPGNIEARITSRTKAIVPVHLFGQPADMGPIMELAQRRGLFVVEDACQAFGAECGGKPVGSWGHAACFSFFPTKNLGTLGDGGVVTTSDRQLARTIRLLRHHGSTRKYFHSRIGYNSRLDELHAGILLAALTHIDDWNAERRRLAERYRERLRDHPWIEIAPVGANRTHVYHLFNIRSDRRADLQEALDRANVPAGVYYPLPLHLQEAYADLGCRIGDFPVAEAMSERLLALPLSPFLLEIEQDAVIRALYDAAGGEPS
jgi:dTDP-4-amino-4,6-dideoxygalactose transaminase